MVICHAVFIPSNLLLKLASLHVSLQAYSGTNRSCLFDRGLLLADESQSSSKRVRGCPKTNCRLPFVVLDLIECSLELRSYSSVTLPLSLIYSKVTTSYFSLTRTSLREKLFQHLLLYEHAPRMRAVIKQSNFGDQSWMT